MSTRLQDRTEGPGPDGVEQHALDRVSGLVASPVRSTPGWYAWAALGGALVLAVVLRAALGWHLLPVVLLSFLGYTLAVYVIYRRVGGQRVAVDQVMRALMYAAFLAALTPLLALLYTVISDGAARASSVDFLSTTMNGVTGVFDQRYAEGEGPFVGGVYHAIIGTLIITLLATLISVPIGMFTAIYLVEYGRNNQFSRAVRFLVDVMTGVPSIVAGLFAFALFGAIFGIGTKNGLAGAVALSVLMIPTVVRNSEEMLRIVPNELREAAYALGVPKWRTIAKVVLPTAISGLASGVTLAIARVIGETAPLLVAVGGAPYLNLNAIDGPMNSLALYAYQMFRSPLNPGVREPSMERAWAAALLLVAIVVLLNLTARLIAKLFAPKTGR